MKHYSISILLVLLMSMACNKTFAYDIAVANADGKTIYYNYTNDGLELQVTSGSYQTGTYSGDVVIPETVTYMNRTRKVTSIGSAFDACPSLTSVTIPNTVKSIGTFCYCSKLKKLIIPNSVTSDIFLNQFTNINHLDTLVIGDGIKSIADKAFQYTTIGTLVIGKGIKTISTYAFKDCSIEKVVVKDLAAWCSINFGYGENYPYADDYYNYSNPLYKTGSLYLLDDIETEIIDLIIPQSVKSISDGAFFGIKRITSVTIPNSVETIGKYSFGMSGLTSVTIPNSVTSIGKGVFWGCKDLISATLSNNITSIEESAFQGCTGLTSMIIPNSVTAIDSQAFYGCSGLTSVTIGSGVTSIGKSAFWGCFGLTSVTIPNSVTAIDSQAFSSSGLTSVTIGSGVTSIGKSAFYGNKIAIVISKIETPFAINGKSSSYPIFSTDTFMNADLFVPVGTIDKYKTTEGWKDFIWITEGIPSGIEGVKTDDDKTEVSRYTLDGKKLSEPQKGINIIKMNDGTTRKEIVK